MIRLIGIWPFIKIEIKSGAIIYADSSLPRSKMEVFREIEGLVLRLRKAYNL